MNKKNYKFWRLFFIKVDTIISYIEVIYIIELSLLIKKWYKQFELKFYLKKIKQASLNQLSIL